MAGRERTRRDMQKPTKVKEIPSLPEDEESKEQKTKKEKQRKQIDEKTSVLERNVNGTTACLFEEEATTRVREIETLSVKQKKRTETTTKMVRKPETPKDDRSTPVTPRTAAPKNSRKTPALNTILTKTLSSLTIRMDDRSQAAEVINQITKSIVDHLKTNSVSFQTVEKPLCTGSYYEKVKISSPDEFDVMIPIPLERVNLTEFGDNGAFYSVALKRGATSLAKFQEKGTLRASLMLKEFREEVKKCVKNFKEWEVEKKKPGCPAVTLTTRVQSILISLDVVLCIMVRTSWPLFTNDGLKIQKWLGAKVRQNFRREPFYLVPKYEGRNVWRISFSHVEKAMLMNHGSEKTCCEKAGSPCCRKNCLKLLKHLLSLLKDEDKSFEKFCSYHAKTTLFHLCCSRSKDAHWSSEDLPHCFQQLLEHFEEHLEAGVLPNFFIPSQNLLSGPGTNACKKLAARVREERQQGFPKLRSQL
uniref:Cyclic GMP-AMP synthase-like n=1 Tax=Gouania willdenowi TaxID=441366 RepID=A0A8C5EN85_GOUWI